MNSPTVTVEVNAMPGIELHTDRLILREWRDEDLPVFAALNADPEVMRYMPKLLSREESDERVRIIREHFDHHGFGLWAVEVFGAEPFVGFVGLSAPWFEAPFTPCVEVGWRLTRAAWGQGYATEAARAALEDGFGRMGFKQIVAFTAVPNLPSQAVMGRLGMTRRPDLDFNHPMLSPGHVLERHLVWSMDAA